MWGQQNHHQNPHGDMFTCSHSIWVILITQATQGHPWRIRRPSSQYMIERTGPTSTASHSMKLHICDCHRQDDTLHELCIPASHMLSYVACKSQEHILPESLCGKAEFEESMDIAANNVVPIATWSTSLQLCLAAQAQRRCICGRRT